MFKIDQFQAEINKAGVLRNNRFVVNFTSPKYLASKYPGTAMQNIMLRCEAAQIPGMQFATVDGPARLGYGPIEATPYGVAFEDVSMTFIVDSKSNLHKYFYDWVNSIVNFQSRGGAALKDALGPVKGMKTFEVGYKNDYSTNIKVMMYNPKNQKILQTTMYKAFPKAVPSMDLSWQATDEIVKLTIPFSYTDFQVEYINAPDSVLPLETGSVDNRVRTGIDLNTATDRLPQILRTTYTQNA